MILNKITQFHKIKFGTIKRARTY